MLLRFAVAQRDEEDFESIYANNQITGNNPASLLYKAKKQLIQRGNYQDFDQKCQSSKSFIDLMETNRFFKELQGEKRVKGDQSRFDEILSEQRFKLEKRISTNIAENRRSINDRNFSFTTNNRTVLT